MGLTAETTVAISAQLYESGTITAKQARDIMDFYTYKFQPAFNLAVDAVQGNKTAISPESIIRLGIELSAMLSQAQNHTSP